MSRFGQDSGGSTKYSRGLLARVPMNRVEGTRGKSPRLHAWFLLSVRREAVKQSGAAGGRELLQAAALGCVDGIPGVHAGLGRFCYLRPQRGPATDTPRPRRSGRLNCRPLHSSSYEEAHIRRGSLRERSDAAD